MFDERLIKNLCLYLIEVASAMKLPLTEARGSFPYPEYCYESILSFSHEDNDYFCCEHRSHGWNYNMSFHRDGQAYEVDLCNGIGGAEVRFRFPCPVSNIWFLIEEKDTCFGSVLVILFKSFMKSIKVSKEIYDDFIDKLKMLIRSCGLSINKASMDKGFEHIREKAIWYRTVIENIFYRETHGGDSWSESERENIQAQIVRQLEPELKAFFCF